MRVEVDVSDLEELDHYIDEKCENLEKILKKDTKLAEYGVKRQFWGGDGEFDTFVIQDAEGVDLVSLNTWEVETLNDSEILAYSDVQIRRDQHSYLESFFLSLIVLAIFGFPGAIFTIRVLFFGGTSNLIIASIALVFDTITLLVGISFYRKRKNVIFEQCQIDILAARENTAFISALRKLASLVDEDIWMLDEFKSRLRSIEDTL